MMSSYPAIERKMSNVLIIEDDDELSSLMQDMLESEGYDVFVAGDGDEGLRAQRAVTADVVITDIFMPNKDGIETIRSLREDYPDLQIVAMSGGGRLQVEGHFFTAKELGARTILRKPFEMADLLDVVSDALRA